MQVGTTRLKRNATYVASSDRSSAYRTQLRKRLCNKSPCSYALLILYTHNSLIDGIVGRWVGGIGGVALMFVHMCILPVISASVASVPFLLAGGGPLLSRLHMIHEMLFQIVCLQ